MPRPKPNLVNPFVTSEYDEDLEGMMYYNSLLTDYVGEEMKVNINVEDILVGCIRSFKAHLPGRQEYINHVLLLRCYLYLDVFTQDTIQEMVNGSKKTAEKYVRAIKLCNPFLLKFIEDWESGKVNLVGYRNVGGIGRGH
jgi:hypothetical protein